MKLLYTKTWVDGECPKNFDTERMGHVACCHAMASLVDREATFYAGWRNDDKYTDNVLKLGMYHEGEEVLANVHMSDYLTSHSDHHLDFCPFCGTRITTEEVESKLVDNDAAKAA